MRRYLPVALITFCSIACSPLVADDWPQWMGPGRNSEWNETGLVDAIPTSGLPVRWRHPIAGGYSGPAVADGRVFVTDYVRSGGESTNNPGGRDPVTGNERVICLDAKSGEELWKVEYPRPYNLSYANGPRATPTVDGPLVYVLGAEGDLLCLQAEDGTVVWRKQLAEVYGAESPIWGHAAHPLVRGNLLYCLAGGEGSTVVALNKLTGEEVWKALSASEMGYCPPTLAVLGGKEHLIIWHADAICGLNPENGSVYWTYELKPQYGMAIAAPRFVDNQMFASAIGNTAALVEFDQAGLPSKTLWQGKPKIGLYAANSTPWFDGQAIYGSDCATGQFIAVNATNGDRYWESFQLTTGGNNRASHGTAFLVKNGDRYVIFTETGDLVLANLTPSGVEERGRMHILEPTSDCFSRAVVWSHPAFANHCVYARNDKEIVCVDLSKQ